MTKDERYLQSFTSDLNQAAERNNTRGFRILLRQIEEYVNFTQVRPGIMNEYTNAMKRIYTLN